MKKKYKILSLSLIQVIIMLLVGALCFNILPNVFIFMLIIPSFISFVLLKFLEIKNLEKHKIYSFLYIGLPSIIMLIFLGLWYLHISNICFGLACFDILLVLALVPIPLVVFFINVIYEFFLIIFNGYIKKRNNRNEE